MTLPYGIDLGCTRIRVAAGERTREGAVRLRAVVTRDAPEGRDMSERCEAHDVLAAILEDAIAEIGARERRCVLSFGGAGVTLRSVRFPRMSWIERRNAARLEAERWRDERASSDAFVTRIHPGSLEESFLLGVAPAERVEQAVRLTKASRLRLRGIDHQTTAFGRLYGEQCAILDIAAERMTLHLPQLPTSFSEEIGGAHVTRAIARDLGIDHTQAERRKRIVGCGGAGSDALDDLVASAASLVARSSSRAPLQQVAVTGNGARIAGFLERFSVAAGIDAAMPVPELLETSSYPVDVIRTAAPDWALAAALLTWELAA